MKIQLTASDTEYQMKEVISLFSAYKKTRNLEQSPT